MSIIATLRTTDREDKRAIILAEAVRLFNEHGFFDTRLEDVATRLGATKTSISYHFRSKDALLCEAYQETCAFAEAHLARVADRANGLERIIAWLCAYAEAQSAAVLGRRDPLAVISDPQALSGDEAVELNRRLDTLASTVSRHLHEGVEDGSVKPASLAARDFLLLGMQQWILRWLENTPPRHHRDAVTGLADLVRYGLAADTRRPPQLSASTSMMNPDVLFDREARNRLKREAFLRTGTRELNARGYRGLSLSDIAAELGVTRGAFYYQFADKDALLLGCFENTCMVIDRAFDAASKPGLSGLDCLERALRFVFERQTSHLDPLIRLDLLAQLPKTQRDVIAAKLQRVKSTIAEALARGVMDGSTRTTAVPGLEGLLLGLIFAHPLHRPSQEPAPAGGTPYAIATARLDVLLYGLAGPGR